MRFLTKHRRPLDSAGFTLIELVVTIAIMSMIMVALTGVVLAYFKHTKTAAARLNESAAVEFVSAYWQRDVSSLGIRSTTYDTTSKTFPLQNSVNTATPPVVTKPDGTTLTLSPGVGKSCENAISAAGTTLITLEWNEYAGASATSPTIVAVTYAYSGTSLSRIRCSYSGSSWALNASTVLSSRVSGTPTVKCDGASCSGATGAPNVVTLKITVLDVLNGQSGPTQYSVTLTGERRQIL